MNINSIVGNLSNINLEDEMLPMKTGKSKSWGGAFEYSWVAPKMLRSVANSKSSADKEKYDWCVQMFGKSGHRWFEKDKKFYFKNEEDMTMFILKWS